jgi:hypothetical protein
MRSGIGPASISGRRVRAPAAAGDTAQQQGARQPGGPAGGEGQRAHRHTRQINDRVTQGGHHREAFAEAGHFD